MPVTRNTYPHRLEQAYVSLWDNYLDALIDEFLPKILRSYKETIQTDTLEDDLSAIEKEARSLSATVFNDIRRMATSFSAWNFNKLQVKLSRVTKESGIPVIQIQRDSPETMRALDKFTRLNAQLITEVRMETAQVVSETIRTKVRQDVGEILRKTITAGQGVRETAKLIREKTGVIRSKAEFWARDQSTKLYGELNRQRQIASGVPGYIWWTSMDARVRPSHAEVHGLFFTWETGAPSLGNIHPGQDFQCRCDADPAMGPEKQLSKRQRNIAQNIIEQDRKFIENREAIKTREREIGRIQKAKKPVRPKQRIKKAERRKKRNMEQMNKAKARLKKLNNQISI
jgi:SPP1 gp7 family putative phage head morphogenesis protein